MSKSLDASQNQNSLFQHILNSDMPESERSEERLAKEAQTLLGGGTASTARTIGFASFWILSRPDIRAKLEEELKGTMRDWPQRVPSWAELERLPYLQAILKESLRQVKHRATTLMDTEARYFSYRLSYGVMHRLPRVSPDLSIQYKQFVIPPGVSRSLASMRSHLLTCLFSGACGYVCIFDAL